MFKKLVLFTITVVFLLCPKVEATQQSATKVKENVKTKEVQHNVANKKELNSKINTTQQSAKNVKEATAKKVQNNASNIKKTSTKVGVKKSSSSKHSVSNVKESIVKHSIELGIDPALALSIAKSESGFRHEARSSGGAVGVFQLMPSTAKRLGVDPYCLSGNIKGGLMYYKKMYSIFGSTELALAAYNAGPTVVKKYNRVPPIGETKKFVSNIMTEYNRQKINPDPAIAKLKPIKTINKTKPVDTIKIEPTVPIPTQGIV